MTAETNNPADIEIDVDALNKKYAEERAKRLRSDAVGQYKHLSGEFAGFDKDPHADPNFTREPIVEDTDVLMIGGGFASLLAGGRLREAGVKDIRIVAQPLGALLGIFLVQRVDVDLDVGGVGRVSAHWGLPLVHLSRCGRTGLE